MDDKTCKDIIFDNTLLIPEDMSALDISKEKPLTVVGKTNRHYHSTSTNEYDYYPFTFKDGDGEDWILSAVIYLAKSEVKTQNPKSMHPPVSEMVTSAIKELKDRKGSSMQAIKKYIVSTYNIDGEKYAPFIKRYLKKAVTSGAVMQTKGKGASGSFKLSTTKPDPKGKVKRAVQKSSADTEKTTEKEITKKAPATKKAAETKKTAEKKSTSAKKTAKTAAAKKVEAVAKQKAATQTKDLSKKLIKTPTVKIKTLKPKITKAATVKTVKTAAAKKIEAATKQKATARIKNLSNKATKASAAKIKTPKRKTIKATTAKVKK